MDIRIPISVRHFVCHRCADLSNSQKPSYYTPQIHTKTANTHKDIQYRFCYIFSKINLTRHPTHWIHRAHSGYGEVGQRLIQAMRYYNELEMNFSHRYCVDRVPHLSQRKDDLADNNRQHKAVQRFDKMKDLRKTKISSFISNLEQE